MAFNLIYWTPIIMRLILFLGFPLGKMWTNMEKRPFFRAAMAGLGKYRMGGYGRIGVYRVKLMIHFNYKPYIFHFHFHFCSRLGI